MRVYKGKIEARNENIIQHTFLRISSRKINILRKTKLGPRELNEVDGINVKQNAAQFNEQYKIYYKNIKKIKK